MLGLADRARVVDLFEALLRGDIAAALAELRDQYDSGADPAVILTDLAEFTHFVTRVKLVPSVADDLSLAEAERMRGRAFAAQLVHARPVAHLADAAEGHCRSAGGRPAVAAAEMVLVRIAYAADLPTPDEVVRSLGNGSAAAAPARPQGNGGGARDAERHAARALRAMTRRAARRGQPPLRQLNPSPGLRTARPNLRRCGSAGSRIWSRWPPRRRDLQIKAALERDVRLVHCEDGQLEIALEPGATKTLVNELSRKLAAWTGRQWMVIVSREAGASDTESAGGRAGRRAQARRARRSAGAGGARPLPRRGNRRRARRSRCKSRGRRHAPTRTGQ